jgi:hypothetical protein
MQEKAKLADLTGNHPFEWRKNRNNGETRGNNCTFYSRPDWIDVFFSVYLHICI